MLQTMQTTLTETEKTEFLGQLIKRMRLMQERSNNLMLERITKLERDVQIMSDLLAKHKDKETVQQTRQRFLERKEREPVTHAIDRNNVAPSSVNITEIFNFSGRRF